jgi:Gas vesicle synthesis protein GvpL/GvpF
VIDLFAITDDPAPPLPTVAPLSAVASHGLALVCAPAAHVEVSPEVLWRHEEVVEALMEDRDLLPVRFGTRLDDETAAARALGERHEALASALDRVRGAVELSVRVLGERSGEADPDPPDPVTGAEYLRAKAAAAAGERSALRSVHEPLASRARESKRLAARDRHELLRAAYLVDRSAVEPFVEQVSRLQHANPRLRLLCTGPWPPYSFTGE